MGYVRHHAVVVTSYDKKRLAQAHKRATKIFDGWDIVSPIITSPVNEYHTFFVAPDGSKEGWSDSAEGDDGRETLIAWLDQQRYEDGSTPLSWVVVQYGDDNQVTEISAHSDEPARQMSGVWE